MTSPLRDGLIGQIEIFKALELAAAQDYETIEKGLINLKFRKTIEAVRADEMSHARICQEIVDFLKK
jgi:rubrerythrin